MSAAAIVSQTDYLLVLPAKVASLLAAAWSLRQVALPSAMPSYHLNCVWHPVQDAQPALRWLKGVRITSDNVCYTKLLRAVFLDPQVYRAGLA